MSVHKEIIKDLKTVSSKEKAKANAWFFKTGKGEYGEGDKFIGVKVPDQRKVAKKFLSNSELSDILKLLESSIHEHRLTALFLLVGKYEKAKDEQVKREIVDFYLKHIEHVNNWDLVDSSAHKILGPWLIDKKDRSILYELAKSGNLWKERVAVIATFAFIYKNDFADSLKIAEALIEHEHDLIHKAVGWMLREVGKKNEKVEKEFIKKHYKTMPRTMLRYAIEKFDKETRKKYLEGKI